MSVLNDIKAKARAKKRRVVLSEGTEPRMIKATRILLEENITAVTLLGEEKEITRLAKENSLDLSNVEVINPVHSPDFDKYVADFMELRKKKGITEKQAHDLMVNPLYFGAMMVRHNKADASVAGSVNTTGDVLRAAIHVLGLKPGIKTVSSCFMMTLPKFMEVENKIFFYGDCAVVPNPDPDELASIAVSTAQTMKNLIGDEPRVAMLSFSTKGSASHKDVDKVLEALAILKRDHPELKVDGEFQLDAAVIPKIGAKKAPGSEIAGNANVLIFPDLDAGNIGYKLTERFAGAIATGPIIQGLGKPANDLSRGCSAEDIVDVAAIAVLLKD
ncbi:MAG: phosphate acetyltransferase [candidate division Zixibacteria bacterium]|nr:phosphate acetyltransferase [candidate division Zixibacteria bacterium]MDD5427346.1 phosphate acetyltransferase [candidate division Zixibacteria bacterium]